MIHKTRLLLPLAVLALGLAACISPYEARAARLEAAALAQELRAGVPEELMPAFEAVVQALEDGDEEVARGALRRVFASSPEGRALELAQAFERILDGRALSAELDFSLVAEELFDSPGRFRITLLAAHHSDEPLRLYTSGARLRQMLLIVSPDGDEHRLSRREAVTFPAELLVPVDETVRVPITELQLQAPKGLLALSSELKLELLPGEFIDASGRSLPAQRVPVEALELVRLAEFLPTTTVEPEEVARYVALGRIYQPALMERVVRVAPERRDEALDELSPLVAGMGLIELELLVPGLRWLSRTTRPGGDPEAWRRWMKLRASPPRSAPDWEKIDLPGS